MSTPSIFAAGKLAALIMITSSIAPGAELGEAGDMDVLLKKYDTHVAEILKPVDAKLVENLETFESKLADKGELPEDGRVYYDMWIKVLEGHYMTLFQTPEYMDMLAKTLNSHAAFQQARNAVIEDMIGNLPIPTRTEIDSLYEDVHRLKRRLRELEKK